MQWLVSRFGKLGISRSRAIGRIGLGSRFWDRTSVSRYKELGRAVNALRRLLCVVLCL